MLKPAKSVILAILVIVTIVTGVRLMAIVQDDVFIWLVVGHTTLSIIIGWIIHSLLVEIEKED